MYIDLTLQTLSENWILSSFLCTSFAIPHSTLFTLCGYTWKWMKRRKKIAFEDKYLLNTKHSVVCCLFFEEWYTILCVSHFPAVVRMCMNNVIYFKTTCTQFNMDEYSIWHWNSKQFSFYLSHFLFWGTKNKFFLMHGMYEKQTIMKWNFILYTIVDACLVCIVNDERMTLYFSYCFYLLSI